MDGSQRSANLDAYSISRQGLPQRDPYGSGYGREASGGPRGSVAAPTEAELLNEYGAGSARPAPPGVGVPAPSRDPYGAAHVPYGGVPSSGARDPYGGAPGGGPSRDPYGGAPAGQGVRDPYSYGGPAQSFDPEEDEVQALKYQIRNTKQESLSSTRNAVRIARETEETATNTLLKLGDQSGTLGPTDVQTRLATRSAASTLPRRMHRVLRTMRVRSRSSTSRFSAPSSSATKRRSEPPRRRAWCSDTWTSARSVS